MLCRAAVAAAVIVLAPTPEPQASVNDGLREAPAGVATPAEGPVLSADGPVETAETSCEAPAGPTSASAVTPWIKRYPPARNMIEAGLYFGVMIPSAEHELYDPTLTHQPFSSAAADIGLRASFSPLSFLAVELEAGIMPTKTADGGKALLYAVRPVIVGQLPLYTVAPFIRVGAGLLGATGDTIGGDVDPSFNFGGGAKIYVHRWVGLRLDVVDNVATRLGLSRERSHNVELLLGVFATLNRAKKQLVDSDGDGLYDPNQGLEVEDVCPGEPGPLDNDGCPVEAFPTDSDGDGLLDPDDQCAGEAGPADNRGCPWPDRDGDGVIDRDDACADVSGPAESQGCPPPEADAGQAPADAGQAPAPVDAGQTPADVGQTPAEPSQPITQ